MRKLFALLAAAILAIGVVFVALSNGGAVAPQGLTDAVSNVPVGAVYGLKDSRGHSMDTLKIVPDPVTAGRFLGVYHVCSTACEVDVATAASPTGPWTYARTLDTAGSQPYIAFSPAPKNGPVIADEASGSHLRFFYWTSVSNMLGTTAPYKVYDAPHQLGSCEGTPDIESVTYPTSTSTIADSTIKGGFHYSGCSADQEGTWTLGGFGSSWAEAAAPAVDQRLTDAGATGKHGDRDYVDWPDGVRYRLYEGNLAAFSWATWSLYLDDGTAASKVSVHTAGGSVSFANPSLTRATVNGVDSLIVTIFIPSEGAAPGEAGELVYVNPVTTAPPPSSSPPASSSPPPSTTTPPPTSSPPPSTTTPPPTTTTAPPPPAITKVLTFVEENHGISSAESGMPNLFTLAKRFGYATNYHAITHPSEPNYLAIAGGSTFGDTGDHNPAYQVAGQSTYGEALIAAKTAKAYEESMPSNCKQSNSSPYAVKHNPWASFTDERTQCNAGDIPSGTVTSGNLATDITNGTLPNYGFVTPNLCNDAHDCSLATADNWLKPWLAKIMAGPDYTSGNLAIVVTFDEDGGTTANTVLTAVITPTLDGAHKVVTTSLNHYSLCRYFSQVTGTAPLRNAATAADFKAAFGL